MNRASNLYNFTGSPEPDVYQHVGRRLRELRISHGATQAEVAKVIDVSPQQYQKYEDAQSRCSLPYLITLSKHFEVHITDILPVEESEPAESRKLNPIQAEADMLAQLVSAFVKLSDINSKLRLVQLVEAIVASEDKDKGPQE